MSEPDYDGRALRRFAAREGRGWLWWAVGAGFLLTVVGVPLTYCSMAANVATAPAGVISATMRPENIIANYEWFRDQYRDIQSFGVRVEVAKRARDTFARDLGADRSRWEAEDRLRYGQLQDNLNGLQSQRARMIETYNARTSMLNRNLFRGTDVPAQIDQPSLED